MRAAFYERTGDAGDVLQCGELPDPEARPGEVRVRLHRSGINPSDVKQRAGRGVATMPFPRIIPHSDGAGVIDAVGAEVDSKRIGQRVWLWNAAYKRADGTAAQYVTLPKEQAVELPDCVSDDAGACLGIPALTALQALLTDGGVVGQRVLVAGGAGAVGYYAIQFARLLGAVEVIATVSSAAKGEVARDAGATHCINYRTDPVANAVLAATQGAGVDSVIEVDVAANAQSNLKAVAEGGTWVVYGSSEQEFKLPFIPLINRAVLARFFSVYRLTPAARRRAIGLLQFWLHNNQIRHLIAECYPLSEIARAHNSVASGATTGNVVLSID
jgi:NADPH:quinone reductase